MNWLLSKRKSGKQILTKSRLSIFMLGIFIVIGTGISGIWADEDNAENDMDHTHFSYQNAAQEQHAHNLAHQAALQDPEVARAIALAKTSKESEDIQNAKDLFQAKMDEVSKHIAELRAEDTGWGKIAQLVNVHPSYLRRGQSITFSKHSISYSNHVNTKSEGKAANARSTKGKASKGYYGRSAVSKGKSLGLSVNNRGSSSRMLFLAYGSFIYLICEMFGYIVII